MNKFTTIENQNIIDAAIQYYGDADKVIDLMIDNEIQWDDFTTGLTLKYDESESNQNTLEFANKKLKIVSGYDPVNYNEGNDFNNDFSSDFAIVSVLLFPPTTYWSGFTDSEYPTEDEIYDPRNVVSFGSGATQTGFVAQDWLTGLDNITGGTTLSWNQNTTSAAFLFTSGLTPFVVGQLYDVTIEFETDSPVNYINVALGSHFNYDYWKIYNEGSSTQIMRMPWNSDSYPYNTYLLIIFYGVGTYTWTIKNLKIKKK